MKTSETTVSEEDEKMSTSQMLAMGLAHGPGNNNKETDLVI